MTHIEVLLRGETVKERAHSLSKWHRVANLARAGNSDEGEHHRLWSLSQKIKQKGAPCAVSRVCVLVAFYYNNFNRLSEMQAWFQ